MLKTSRRCHKATIFAYAGILTLAACADNSGYNANLALPPNYQPLEPVNFVMYPGSMVGPYDGIVLDHVQQKIVHSRIFAAVETGPGPYPITLRVDLSVDCPMGLGDFAGAMIGAGSLYLLPHTETCDYTVDTEFFRPDQIVARRSYTVSYTKTIQMGINDQAHGNGLGFDDALEKMLADFAANPPIPRAEAASAVQGRLQL